MAKTYARSQPRQQDDSRRADPAKALNHRERQAKRKQDFVLRVLCVRAAVVVIAMVMIPCLCWLFLAYNRPEFLEQILAFIACMAGGYGWARGNSKSGGERYS
ncbi:MAG TPA: hypothetical protein VMS17_33855 [Gemmataceae bacterium]|nr:hypothetical protein [Gemmataceae bacterium]